jgi:hypothetical protein
MVVIKLGAIHQQQQKLKSPTKRIGAKFMCSRTICRKCGKPTWSGCGNHIEQALKGVAKKDRCQGHANDPVEPGFFAKMFGTKK